MPPLILYLLKVNAVLLLFALTYCLILRNLTFYKVNRFFLLCGLLFSSVYPFIDLTNLFYAQKNLPAYWENYVPTTTLNELARPGFAWQGVIWVFYAGMLLMLVRFLMQLLSLRKIHSRSFLFPSLGKKVRVLHERIYPFTFWQNIYINPSLHEEEELKLIMEHERVHVKQWHTLDILLSQLSGIFYWFNPGVWFVKEFIKENLEFLTDDAVLKKGIERKQYQYNVLKVEAGLSSLALTNGFNLSGIKRRIRMMNTGPSARFKLLIYFFLLPALIIFSLAFTITKTQIETRITEIKIKTEGPLLNLSPPVVGSGKLSPDSLDKNDKGTASQIAPRKKRRSGIVKKNIAEPLYSSEIMNQNDALISSPEVEHPRIKVVGHPSKIIGTGHVLATGPELVNDTKKTSIQLKGIRILRNSDTKAEPVIYFKNGEKISGEELSLIETAEISRISVIKNKEGAGEIYLEMKDPTELKKND